MQRVVVLGCNSLQLTPTGIQVLYQSHPSPIPWRDVTAAALAGQDRQMMQMFEGMAAQSAPPAQHPVGIPALGLPAVYGDLIRKLVELQQTHDALLIVYRTGMVHVLIEQSGPERDALLAALRVNLGARWLGEDFTTHQLEQRFAGGKKSGCPLRFFGCAMLLVAVLIIPVIGSIVAAAIPGATLSAILSSLLQGDWKTALIASAALVVIVLGYFGVKKVARDLITILRARLK